MIIKKFESFKFNSETELILNDILDKMSFGEELSDFERFNLDYISKNNSDIISDSCQWFLDYYANMESNIDREPRIYMTLGSERVLYYDLRNPMVVSLSGGHFSLFKERFGLQNNYIVSLQIYIQILNKTIFKSDFIKQVKFF